MAAVAEVPSSPAETTSSLPWATEKRWNSFRNNRDQKSRKISSTRKRKLSQLTQQEKNAHRKLPLEILAKEWLNEHGAGIDTRCYLVEKLLPTLVVGLEKLLTEVSLRELTDVIEMQPNFNPINFVAQYLMRNNPRYSNFAEAHPYCRTMRQVGEDVKKVAYSIEENKLAELKAKTKHRCAERERVEAIRAAEEKRRKELLVSAFSEWLLSTERSISLSDLKLALRSWLKIMSEHTLASTIEDLFAKLLSSTERQLKEEQFVADVMECANELPSDIFDQLADHLRVCGGERRKNKLKELRMELLSGVFVDCDPDKTGVVDRLRVLHLFSCFYDTASSDIQGTLHNPRKWPIVEVIEADELIDEEDGSTTFTTLSEQEYKEFMNGSEEGETVKKKEEKEKEEEATEVATEVATTDEKEQTKDGGTEEKGPEETAPKEGDVETQKKEDDSEASSSDKKTDDQETSKVDDPAAESKDKEPETVPTAADDDSNQNDNTPVQTKDGEPQPEDSAESGQKEPASSRATSSARPPRSVSVLESRLRAKSTSILRMRMLTGMSVTHPMGVSGPGLLWDYCVLACAQFVQLVELFLGPEPEDSTVDAISTFFRNNYTETAQERAERLEVAQQKALVLSRRKNVAALFELWDNDRSGYLELEELQLVLSKWKGFGSEQAREYAVEILSTLDAQHNRLTQLQFQIHIEQLSDGMQLSEFEDFMDYLTTSVKLSFEEQRRGELRSKLLSKIHLAGKTSGLDFTQAMKAAVLALHQDNVEFGGGKNCTVAMAVLEDSSSSRATDSLSYKAASANIEGKVVGRKMSRSSKQGVSFLAVNTARPVHVADIQKHGRVHFFIPEHRVAEYKGSLVVSPIITPRHTVVGTFSIDTLTEGDERTMVTFKPHEINFHQGVGVCLGEVYHWINARQQLIKVSQSALNWVHRRCPQVTQADIYIIEPPGEDDKGSSTYTLRCMLSTTSSNSNDDGDTESKRRHKELLHRHQNLFRDYLFQCVDNSEPVSSEAYGRHHLAYPIRDHTGCAVAVIDFCMPPTQALKAFQMKELTRVLKLLTVAFYHLSYVQEQGMDEELEEDTTFKALGFDFDASDFKDKDITLLFDKLMLMDLRESVGNLDKKMFAELRSYIEPPEVILNIIRALLYIVYPDQEFNAWSQCKQYITLSLVKTLESYDPMKEENHTKIELINELLKGVTPGSIQMQGSLPAKYIYNWTSICASLLEHTASNNPTSSDSSQPTTVTTTTSGRPLNDTSQSSVKEKSEVDADDAGSNPPLSAADGDRSSAASSLAASTPEVETPTAPATETQTAPATETQTAPATETQTAPATESQTAPATETQTAPATETQTAPATETQTAPATETQTAPTS